MSNYSVTKNPEGGWNVKRIKDTDPHGHLWNGRDIPTEDDDGEMSRYGRCTKCGAVENTDESVVDCPNVLTYPDSSGVVSLPELSTIKHP